MSSTAKPPVEWGESKNVRWKVEIPGRGSSSPVVWGDRVYVLTAAPVGAELAASHTASRGPLRYMVLALDRKTGKTVWERTAREEPPHEGAHQQFGTYASSSAVTDGEIIVASFESRGIYAYDMNGKPLWSVDLGDKRMRNEFGEGSTPALHKDKVFVVWDHQGESFIAALDRKTGKEVWRKNRQEIDSWATPLVVEQGGKAQVITGAQNRVRSYDADTGDMVWEAAGLTANPIPSPVAADGMVYLMSGYPREQPQGREALRREGRHHGNARAGVVARPRHAVRPVAAALRQRAVLPEGEHRCAVSLRREDRQAALPGAENRRRPERLFVAGGSGWKGLRARPGRIRGRHQTRS